MLVSGTDGVGTKPRSAFLMDKHDTVGIDCVAMCVNDIVCSGAQPLFFLDYIACGKNVPERIADIVKGVSEGCVQAGAALIGGETAEMPGFYPEDEYDLAGFAVGLVDKERILDSSTMRHGDALIALPLLRRTFQRLFAGAPRVRRGERSAQKVRAGAWLYTGRGPARADQDIWETRARHAEGGGVSAVSHITGGGFCETSPRPGPRLHGADRKGGGIETRLYLAHRGGWEHTGAGHVQHLQHGRGMVNAVAGGGPRLGPCAPLRKRRRSPISAARSQKGKARREPWWWTAVPGLRRGDESPVLIDARHWRAAGR